MTLNPREQQRQLENLLRLGTILEINYQNATARVESGGIQTDFLPWFTPRAGNVRIWSPPSIGEQVQVLAVSGDFNNGVILPALFAGNAPNQSPDELSIHFPDGAVMKYNHASGHFSLTGCKTGEIQAESQIQITCPTVNIEGNVNINGSLSTTGTSQTQGNISTQGSVTASGDIKAGGISLQNHTHIEQGDGQPTSRAK